MGTDTNTGRTERYGLNSWTYSSHYEGRAAEQKKATRDHSIKWKVNSILLDEERARKNIRETGNVQQAIRHPTLPFPDQAISWSIVSTEAKQKTD